MLNGKDNKFLSFIILKRHFFSLTYIVWVMDFNSDFVEKYTNSRYEGYAIRAVYVLWYLFP